MSSLVLVSSPRSYGDSDYLTAVRFPSSHFSTVSFENVYLFHDRPNRVETGNDRYTGEPGQRSRYFTPIIVTNTGTNNILLRYSITDVSGSRI